MTLGGGGGAGQNPEDVRPAACRQGRNGEPRDQQGDGKSPGGAWEEDRSERLRAGEDRRTFRWGPISRTPLRPARGRAG